MTEPIAVFIKTAVIGELKEISLCHNISSQTIRFQGVIKHLYHDRRSGDGN